MDYRGYEFIVTEYDDGVLTVMFNRPEVRNALNPGMQREFREILEKLEVDQEVGAVILTGAGDRGFCATLGVVAGDGGTVHWPLSMSIYKAKEYLLTGDFLSAKDAAAMGMINYALPYAEVMPKAKEIARKLAGYPRWSVRWTKASLNRIVRDRSELTMDLATALEMVTLASEDHRESLRAFVERRPPKYTGR